MERYRVELKKGVLKDLSILPRKDIRRILAETEAAIDFPEDVGDDIDDALMLSKLQEAALLPLKALLAQYDAGHVLREGLKVIVAGKPNVGKSSLMNRLLDQDRAIVTAIPGTTRDFIEESLPLGFPSYNMRTISLRAILCGLSCSLRRSSTIKLFANSSFSFSNTGFIRMSEKMFRPLSISFLRTEREALPESFPDPARRWVRQRA